MITITISHAEWGYLTNLQDFSGGGLFKGAKPEHGGHRFRRGFERTVIPGVSDNVLLPDFMASKNLYRYGYVKPWKEEGHPEEMALQDAWAGAKPVCLDYYVAQRNGSPCPEAVLLYYPSRVFVEGENEDGEPLQRYELLQHLRAVGARSHSGFWEPCQVFHGLAFGGVPRFKNALRAETNSGPSWSELLPKLQQNLPPGYEWQRWGSSNSGTLTFEQL